MLVLIFRFYNYYLYVESISNSVENFDISCNRLMG